MPYNKKEKWKANYIKTYPRILERNREWYAKLKQEVLKHYSPNLVCLRCGFSDIRALTIDHIEGCGNEHRRQLANATNRRTFPGGWNLYRWLKNNNYPDGYQVLCMNCQFITAREYNEKKRMEA